MHGLHIGIQHIHRYLPQTAVPPDDAHEPARRAALTFCPPRIVFGGCQECFTWGIQQHQADIIKTEGDIFMLQRAADPA